MNKWLTWEGTKKSWNTLYCQKVRNYTKNNGEMSNEHKHQPERETHWSNVRQLIHQNKL